MKWFQIDKRGAVQPQQGPYRVWKPQIRREGRYQCVYCAIKEQQFGGLRNFHVEHYRPRKHFPQLTEDIVNLFYACGICNSFKGGSWPSEPDADHSVAAFPCPADVDYSDILNIEDDYTLVSSVRAGCFLIERLYLNRPQLIYTRRFFAMVLRLRALAEEVTQLIEHLDASNSSAMIRLIREQAAATLLLADAMALIPYNEDDVQR
jgi:hypothetical protein